MKKLPLIVFCGLIIGCSSIQEDFYVNNQGSTNESISHRINLSQAIEMGQIAIGLNQGSRSELVAESIIPICRTNPSRSNNESSDTLAYVINYQNDGGFAIISADNRVFPILAFSETGSFSMENEIAKKYFINNIEPYIDSNKDSNITYDDVSDFMAGCYMDYTPIGYNLHQKNPFNKYIENSYPVGCVALATAQALMASKYGIIYHNHEFELHRMQRALCGDTIYDFFSPPMPYETAVDEMALLLKYVGQDIETKYNRVSTAKPKKSLEFMIKQGCEIDAASLDEPSLWAYEPYDIAYALYCGSVAVLTGREPADTLGHAWIADGYQICVDYNDYNNIPKPSFDNMISVSIHCDWGWGGLGNGYYSGFVFNVGAKRYTGYEYYASKRYNHE